MGSGDRIPFEVVSDGLWRPDRIVARPAGGAAAFVVPPTDGGDERWSGVWYGPLSGQPARLTEEVPATNLALCPAGTRLAYARWDVAGAAEVVLHELTAGTVRRFPISGYPEVVEWSGADLLVLVAEPGADTASLSSGKPLDEPLLRVLSTRVGTGWRRVWRLDTTDGALRAVSPPDLTVWEFCRLDDDRVVAVCGPDPTESGWYHPTLAILGPTPADRQDLHVSDWQLSCPTVHPDGTRVAYLEGWASDRGLHTGEVRVRDLAGGAAVPVQVPGVDATWLRWSAGDRLWFAGWSGLGTAWGWLDRPGRPGAPVAVWPEVAGCLNSRWHPEVAPAGGGRALTVRSTPFGPPEVTLLRGGAPAQPWSRLNARVPTERGLRVDEVRWPDPDGGSPIEGLLVLPTRVDGKPFPLVVNLHGGPTVAYHHSWDLGWAETLTGAGYAVLLPNECGGAGRGQAFGRGNLCDPAGAEYRQILAGVEHCVRQGYADGDRIAALGASYGGYLAAWALAQGDLFACAVVIAGISDLLSCWGTANNGAFYDFLCAGGPELFVERSPVTCLGDRSRPALILHGAADRCVPVSQAEELFAGLRDAGVPAELVVYPDEGHQTLAIGALRDQRARVLRWLAEHLPPR